MRVLVAPDAFKGSLAASEVAACVAEGLRAALPGAAVTELPVADGGEGTVATLVGATGGRLVWASASGPRGTPLRAQYGLLGDGRTCAVEVAAASGLALLGPAERDPRLTTTYGTGELIAEAVRDHGRRRVLVCLGGSATCDAGAGLAQALGVRLLDALGRPLARGGAALAQLARIDPGPVLALGLEVIAACDVTNPLCGPEGAAAVYGPQKGADPAAVAELDAALARFAEVAERDLGRRVADVPGAGAAGGLGAGLVAMFGATLCSGVDLVLDAVDLNGRLRGVDLVVTGEGRLDAQTLRGKAPLGVLTRARAAGVPVVAVAGGVEAEALPALHQAGFAATLAAVDRPMTLEEAVAEAPALLRRAGERAGRLFAAGRAARREDGP